MLSGVLDDLVRLGIYLWFKRRFQRFSQLFSFLLHAFRVTQEPILDFDASSGWRPRILLFPICLSLKANLSHSQKIPIDIIILQLGLIKPIIIPLPHTLFFLPIYLVSALKS